MSPSAALGVKLLQKYSTVYRKLGDKVKITANVERSEHCSKTNDFHNHFCLRKTISTTRKWRNKKWISTETSWKSERYQLRLETSGRIMFYRWVLYPVLWLQCLSHGFTEQFEVLLWVIQQPPDSESWLSSVRDPKTIGNDSRLMTVKFPTDSTDIGLSQGFRSKHFGEGLAFGWIRGGRAGNK